MERRVKKESRSREKGLQSIVWLIILLLLLASRAAFGALIFLHILIQN
jgi:hypothetical protein